MKIVLPCLVGKFQTAFVKGRRIGDNILLAQELFRNYHRDKGSPRCAIKVDLMKAYDTVRWDFINNVLQIVGFPDTMVRWIMECVTTPWFSVNINGELNGYFPGGRGLRQGDPMSPYIFVLAMEAFSGLLDNSIGQLKFHWRCKKERIYHLCFADDLLIFCRGDPGSVEVVRDCLDNFKFLSGLSPNPSKSNILTCGVDRSTRELLQLILGFNEGYLPFRYLGVPLISSKLRKVDCIALVDRITSRIKSWTCRFLSYAGRVQLVKSFLFATQVYWSSLFILPKGVMKNIEQVLRSFLWKGVDASKGGCKVAWGILCLPRQEGGLGIKSIGAWNQAAMTKHIWHLCSDFDQSIWTNWVRSYLVRDRNFWSLRPPGDCSWTWRKIMNLRSIVLDNFSLNDGRVTWNMSPNGVFTTKSAWDFFRDKGAPVPWHQMILFSGMVPRHAMILWLVARGRLNTLDRLASFGISQSLTRPLCNGDNENLSHVLFSCQFSNRICF